MKITESKMMPHPGGFGWGFYSRVRTLAANEAMPADAVAADDNAADTDWQPAAESAPAAVTSTGASGPTNTPTFPEGTDN